MCISNISEGHIVWKGWINSEEQAKKRSHHYISTRKGPCMSTSAFDTVLNCNSYIQNEPERFIAFEMAPGSNIIGFLVESPVLKKCISNCWNMAFGPFLT